jgi:DNA-binding Lrp family transcriptional regulator
MSIHYISASFRAKTGNPLRKLVLIKLCDNANDDGYCFPSYKRISDECEISRRSVINHINQLEIDGIIAKSNRFKNGEFTSNEFIINYKRLIELGSESVALGSESVALGSAGDARGVVQEMHLEPSLLTVNEPSINRQLIVNESSIKNNVHFEKFWEIYDKKIDRKSCQKIWAKINPSEEEAIKIVFAAGEYVKTVTDKQFQKHPKTWLNNESWNNDLIISNGAQNVTKHQTHVNAANAIINSAINSAGSGYSFFAPDSDLRASVVAEFPRPTNLGCIESGVD